MNRIYDILNLIGQKISSKKDSGVILALIKKNLDHAALSGNVDHLFTVESFRQALLDNYLMITDVYKLIIGDFE